MRHTLVLFHVHLSLIDRHRDKKADVCNFENYFIQRTNDLQYNIFHFDLLYGKMLPCIITRESNRLKYRSRSGSGSGNLIFNGSVPFRFKTFQKFGFRFGSGSVAPKFKGLGSV